MIRTIRLISRLAIVVSISAILYLWVSTTTNEAFPENQECRIQLQIEGGTLEAMSGEQRADQLRDWLLYTVVSSSGLSEEDVNLILYDIPPVRHEYLRSLGNFETGVIRSAYLGGGLILALVPTNGTATDQLLSSIADKHRMLLGKLPASISVFEYEIDLDGMFALITRRGSRATEGFFTEKYGYHEAMIRSLPDLETFLTSIDDLTFASFKNGELLVGGRDWLEETQENLSAEDIAALWQAHKKIVQQLEEFERRWSKEEEEIHEAPTYNLFKVLKQRTGQSAEEWEQERKEVELAWLLRQKERQQALARLREGMETDWKERKLVRGSGFSLDWSYNFVNLANFFDRIAPELYSISMSDKSSLSAEDLKHIHEELSHGNPYPLLHLIGELLASESSYELGLLLDLAVQQYRFQLARYDGDLQGTEVGMVLFYTDLLAKLWAFDYLGFTTETAIEDFIPETQIVIPQISEEGLGGNVTTRVWLGAKESGFRFDEVSKNLLFARTATEIFAASAKEYEPGVESEPRPETAAFLNWWNDHFQEVASYEPMYRQLNQIVKWSLLINWLGEIEQDEALTWLATVEVDRSNWFPHWARERPELRFNRWDAVICHKRENCKVEYFDRGYLGTTTEVMPVLSSSFQKDQPERRSFSGGVSLPERIHSRPRRVTEDVFGNRQIVVDDETLITIRADTVVIRRLDRFSGEETSTVVSKAKWLERETNKAGTSYEFPIWSDRQQYGQLKVSPRSRQRFITQWESRDVEAAQSLGRRLSSSPQPERLLKDLPDIENTFKLPDNKGFLVKQRGSERWLQIGPERSSKDSIKVAGQIDGGTLYADWIDDLRVRHEMKKSHYIVDGLSGYGQGLWKKVGRSRAPPSKASRTVEFEIGETKLPGRFDPKNGKLYFEGDDLARLSNRDLEAVQRELQFNEMQRLRILASKDKKAIRYRIHRSPWQEVSNDIAGGNFEKVSKKLLRDPQAYKLHLSKQLSQDLRSVDSLTRDGYHDTALLKLERMIDVYGPVPELALRRGVIKLARESPRSVEFLNRPWKQPLKDRQRFFKELEWRLAQPDLKSSERANLHTLAEYADWNDCQTRGVVPGGRISLETKGDVIEMKYHMRDLPLGQKRHRIDEIPEGARIYIEDSPELGHLDWSSGSARNSLEQAVSGKLGHLKELERQDIAHFRPGSIYTGENRRFVRVSVKEAVGAGLAVYLAYEVVRRVRNEQKNPVYMLHANVPLSDRTEAISK